MTGLGRRDEAVPHPRDPADAHPAPKPPTAGRPGADADPPLRLDPRTDAPTDAVLADAGLLRTLVDALGSPLNVVFPERIAANVSAFRAVLDRHRLRGTVYFAHKANRSDALVRRLVSTEAGIDVASLGELRHALGAGFTGPRIVATGPKNPAFLWLAARTGATVSADSAAEVRALLQLVRHHRLPVVPVLLRLSGFDAGGGPAGGVRTLSRDSRFGTALRDLDPVLSLVADSRDALELVGVSYHLDTSSVQEKATALEQCILVLDDCRRRGLAPRRVNVGGGFGVNYLADAGQWDRYTTALTEAVLGRRAPMTWQGHGYGLRAEAGTAKGALGLYRSHRTDAGERYLDQLLATTTPAFGRPLGTVLLENLYDLDVEPGRALADQCGITLARVLSVTPAGDHHMVHLEMNRDDVSFESGGVLIDPVIVPRGGTGSGRPCRAYLVGNLCLESDFVTRRLVDLPAIPAAGDLAAFVNTAGYFSDFSATHALYQPTATTVAVDPDRDGVLRWRQDDLYWPIEGS